MRYYVKLDLDGKPVSLLRTDDDSTIDTWYQGAWEATDLFIGELSGLGGSSDYWRVKAKDVARIQKELD